MAIDYKNKYMQVFQDYNEFSEHSADYVRGEDHIAFLIEENEVIYWLYLEQVWRPLNVRTTQTGTLEDGRTKVAVRLEYIEGGQKYTAVPNIPDPERITSMSHFLEDYPDIEEVNVSGTVNLTDLSYAFAGSNIKDFSMLDTSNVNNITGFINSVRDETLNIDFKTNKKLINNWLQYVTLNNLKININAEADSDENIITFDLYNVECNNYELVHDNLNYRTNISGSSIDTVKNENGIVNLQYSALGGFNDFINNVFANEVHIDCDSINAESINIVCDTCILEDDSYSSYNFKYKASVNANNLIIGNGGSKQISIQFGSGIKYNEDINISINIPNNRYIPSFIFTVPIIDDSFYTKYAQYNTPISIFQYKTVFEEVADVNISSEVDSSLLYVDWSSINWDTSNMNIEIHNNIDLNPNSKFTKHFAKLIIENNEETIINGLYFLLTADEGYISGIYNSYLKQNIIHNNLFKNIVFNNCGSYTGTEDLPTILTDNNISFDDYVIISLTKSVSSIREYDCSKLIKNGILKCPLDVNTQSSNSNFFVVKYVENINIEINLNGGLLGCYASFYFWYLKNSTNEKRVKFNNGSSTRPLLWCMTENYATHPQYDNYLTDVYVETDDNTYISNIIYLQYINSNGIHYESQDILRVNNIYGNINIIINYYAPGYTYKFNNSVHITHIDINKVKCNTDNGEIMSYMKLDDETTINLITKLVDNTGNTSKTIYMYRSQANIIGDDNIAAAVAKNYEFAIIEN